MDLDSLLPQPWMAEGSCTSHPDPDLWHTDRLDDLPVAVVADRTREAIAICHACPVSSQCQAFGRLPGPSLEYGIYGGTTPNERGRVSYLRQQQADQLGEWARLVAAGWTKTQVGALYGVSQQAVSKALAKTG